MAETTTANSKISHSDRADDAEVVGRIFVAHSLKGKSKSHHTQHYNQVASFIFDGASARLFFRAVSSQMSDWPFVGSEYPGNLAHNSRTECEINVVLTSE